MRHNGSYRMSWAYHLKIYLSISSFLLDACYTRPHPMESGENMSVYPPQSFIHELLHGLPDTKLTKYLSSFQLIICFLLFMMWKSFPILMKLPMLNMLIKISWRSYWGKQMLGKMVWSYPLGSGWLPITFLWNGGTISKKALFRRLWTWKPFISLYKEVEVFLSLE